MNMEPENHPFGKENHLQTLLYILGSMVVFGGVVQHNKSYNLGIDALSSREKEEKYFQLGVFLPFP